RVPSFDHLVGQREQRGWHRETERLSGFEVDHQFNFGALLDGEISWFCALEDFSDIDPRAFIKVSVATSVAHQATNVRKDPGRINRWHRIAGHQLNNLFASREEKWIRRHNESPDAILTHGRKVRFKFVVSGSGQHLQALLESRGCRENFGD